MQIICIIDLDFIQSLNNFKTKPLVRAVHDSIFRHQMFHNLSKSFQRGCFRTFVHISSIYPKFPSQNKAGDHTRPSPYSPLSSGTSVFEHTLSSQRNAAIKVNIECQVSFLEFKTRLLRQASRVRE